MLRDGVYELYYRAEAEPHSGYEILLLALRNGSVLGSDRWGGVFTGRCKFDVRSHEHHIQVRLLVPRTPRAHGDQIDISVTLGDRYDISSGYGLVDVGGQQVRVELQFKGPVPV